MQPWSSIERGKGYRRITVEPQNGAVGAEISGVDLTKPIDGELRDEILRAFAENLVIWFRDQHGFSRENHLAFAQMFGPLQKIPHILSIEGYPDVQIVERLADDTRRVVGEGYHNDSTFMTTPPTTVTMHAINVPDYGGDTAFANMYLAFETLSEPMKAWLRTLNGVHSAELIFGSGADQKRVMMKEMDPREGDRQVVHPLVCVHPLSGREYLFANIVYTRRIEGFSQAESRALLDFLCGHATSLAFTGRVRWRNDTVLIWDNRCCHHSAIADYQGKYRYMERVTTGGEVPVSARALVKELAA